MGSGSTRPPPPALGPEEHAVEAMRRRLAERMFGEVEAPLFIGRFRVLKTLGRGGMGVVYSAEDDKLGRVVAVKVIRRDVLANQGWERQRLLAEARTLARLAHPNVVQIYDTGEVDDEVFLAMEHVAGETLQQWCEARPRPLADILDKFVQAARGLAAAHAIGIVHRDFKPSNALVGEDGRVRLIDFGLARRSHASSISSSSLRAVSHEVADTVPSALERSDAIAGTPAYMSPEHWQGRDIDAQSDQFSFCVALHEAALGCRPFAPDEVRRAVVAGRELRVAVPGRNKAPRWLLRVLARGLQFAPERRFSGMAALVAAIEAASRRRTRMLAGGLSAFLVAGGLVGGLNMAGAPAPCPDPSGQLHDAWNEARRAEIHRRFTAAGLPYAESAWTHTSEAIDAYAGAWAAGLRDTCEATRIRMERSEELLDRSALCFERRRRDLVSLLEVLQAAAPATIASAEELMPPLSTLASCSDPEFLLRDDTPVAAPTPTVEALRDRLARADLLHRARQSDLAEAEVEAVITGGRAAGNAALEAEALLLRAEILRESQRDPSAAIEALHAAHQRATEAGHSEILWRIWNELAQVTATSLEQTAQARIWLGNARASLARQGADPLATARVQSTAADILTLEERHTEALPLREEVLATSLRLLPPTHPELVRARIVVAHALAELKRAPEALRMLHALRDEQAERLGEDHPATVLVEHQAAEIHYELGEYDAARRLLDHERRVVVRIDGEGSAAVAAIDLLVAAIDFAEGRWESAIVLADSAVATMTRKFPPAYSLRVGGLALLVELYRVTKRRADGVTIYRELLRLHDEYGVDPDLSAVLNNLIDGLCTLGRCPEAMPYLSRLLATHAEKPPDAAQQRAFPLQGLGHVHLLQGEPAMALPFLTEAYRLVADDPTSAPEFVATSARLLARALTELKIHPARVKRLLRAADQADRRAAAQLPAAKSTPEVATEARDDIGGSSSG